MLASHFGSCLHLHGSPKPMVLAEIAGMWEHHWGLENEGSTSVTERLSHRS